jgi:hypothetical protein
MTGRKKFAGWLAGAAVAVASALVATRGGGHRTPTAPVVPTVPSYTLVAHVCNGACDQDEKLPGSAVSLDGAAPGVVADASGNAAFVNIPAGRYRVCARAEGFKEFCADHGVPADGEVYLALERDVPPIQALSTSGRIILAGGAPWRYKGISAFKLLDIYAHGGDWRAVLKRFDRIREELGLRSAPGSTSRACGPTSPGKDTGWEAPSPDVVAAFANDLAREGWYVEFTLLTDDVAARIPQARQLVATLVAARPPNVLLEAGNEPTTHKDIQTAALRGVLEASGFLYSSGDYEEAAATRFYGSYGTAHTGRTVDFPRRAHDLLEYFNGGGPNALSDPPHRVPWVADEPAKPTEFPAAADADWLAYFGAASLLGAGATFHYEGGKFGQLPTDAEAHVAALALQAMNAFPADAPLGAYRRVVEPGQNLDGRTYVVGAFMVRSQQRGAAAPEPGWTPIDGGGALWKR